MRIHSFNARELAFVTANRLITTETTSINANNCFLRLYIMITLFHNILWFIYNPHKEEYTEAMATSVRNCIFMVKGLVWW